MKGDRLRIVGKAGRIRAVARCQSMRLAILKAADDDARRAWEERNTYHMPDGLPLSEEVRRWFREQAKQIIGDIPTIGAPLPPTFAPLADYDDPMASAMTPLLSVYWQEGYTLEADRIEARTGLDMDTWEVVSPELEPTIRAQAFDFCSSTNATTTQTIADAHAALRQAMLEGLVGLGEADAALAERVKQIFAVSDSRALTIATTEASRAVHMAQVRADIDSETVQGFELLLSSDACDLCRKIATECKRVRPGQAFAVVGENPTYKELRHPPLHPRCQCSLTAILRPEWGGPEDAEFGTTLIQPQEGIGPDGYKPPRGATVPEPEPEKLAVP